MGKKAFYLAALLLLLFAAANAWAFRLPPENADELYRAQINQLTDTIAAQRWAILILCVTTVLSLAVTLFLCLSLWKSQKQTSEAMESVRNINLMKETAVQIASSARRKEEQIIKDIADEDLDDVEIKIVRSGL
jgi:hypothetical protein